AAPEARVVEVRAARIRDRGLARLDDHDRIALADAIEQLDDVGIRHADAAVRSGASQSVFVIRTVDVDVALERIAAGAAVDTSLEPVEPEDACEDQVRSLVLTAPHTSRRLAALEDRSALGAGADLRVNPVPAWRRAVRALLAPDPVGGGR